MKWAPIVDFESRFEWYFETIYVIIVHIEALLDAIFD